MNLVSFKTRKCASNWSSALPESLEVETINLLDVERALRCCQMKYNFKTKSVWEVLIRCAVSLDSKSKTMLPFLLAALTTLTRHTTTTCKSEPQRQSKIKTMSLTLFHERFIKHFRFNASDSRKWEISNFHFLTLEQLKL